MCATGAWLVFVHVAAAVGDGGHDIEDSRLERPEWVDGFAEDGRELDRDEETDDADVGEVVGVADDGDDGGGEGAKLRRQRRHQHLVLGRPPVSLDQPDKEKRALIEARS